jgi:cell division protein FtsB
MTGRRGRDGDETPRVVRGAWTTPAVVVRRPDGSVVEPGSGGDRDRDRDRGRDAGPRQDRGAGGGQRIRPRRIPGAPGAVLLVPTLSHSGVVAEGRRHGRNSGPPASVSPLPPRPPAPEPDGPPAEAPADGRALPSLALVGDALRKARGRGRDGDAGRDGGGGKGTTAGHALPRASGRGGGAGRGGGGGPRTTARDALRRARGRGHGQKSGRGGRGGRSGAGRTARVVGALRAVHPGRLLPGDPEERAQRLLRLRRVCVGVAAAVVACVVVYTVFPVRTALNLWEAEDRARERQAAFERETRILEEEIADLQSDERIEVEAREQGMVLPGEESYGIMPAPAPGPDSSTSTTTPSSTSTTVPAG